MKLTVRKRQIGTIPVLEVVPEDLVYEAIPLVVLSRLATRKGASIKPKGAN